MKTIAFELGGKFPWIRRMPLATVALIHAAELTAPVTPIPTAAPVHRSWVQTHLGIGWIHHHEPDGFVIELGGGQLVKLTTDRFKNLADQR